MGLIKMSDQEKIDKLEKQVKQLEDIVSNLTYNGATEQICVYKKADKYYIKIPLHQYIHDYYNDFTEVKNDSRRRDEDSERNQ